MNEFLTRLDAFRTPIPIEEAKRWMEATALSEHDLARYVRFHPRRYLRNLVHDGPTYHLLLLCWQAGQRSPIHDHSGSGCAVKILRGTATETAFERGPNGMVYPTGSRTLGPGEICASEDSDVHQISNLQAGGLDLITLHLYSPPLLTMNVYSLVDPAITRFNDPINEEFVGGSGI